MQIRQEYHEKKSFSPCPWFGCTLLLVLAVFIIDFPSRAAQGGTLPNEGLITPPPPPWIIRPWIIRPLDLSLFGLDLTFSWYQFSLLKFKNKSFIECQFSFLRH